MDMRVTKVTNLRFLKSPAKFKKIYSMYKLKNLNKIYFIFDLQHFTLGRS